MSSNVDHSFATPGPAGLGALAVACFGFAGVFLGKVGMGGLPLLAAWLVGGGIIQYTVAVMELKDNNLTGGNVFLFFAAFFMFAASLSVIAKFFMIKFGITPMPFVEGCCWLAGALFLTIVTPAYLKATKLLFAIVVFIDIALWIITAMDLGILSGSFKPYVAYSLIAAGLIAIYTIGAIVNNAAFERQILPIPEPFVKS